MLRARLSNGDFLFGVDAENIRRLTHGMPLMVDLTSLGGTDKLLIVFGPTMHDIMEQLEQTIGPLPTAQPLPPDFGTPQ